MKESSRLIKVFSGTEAQVYLLKAKLEQKGIPVFIRNVSGDSSLLTIPIAIDLNISDSDLDAARPVIEEFI